MPVETALEFLEINKPLLKSWTLSLEEHESEIAPTMNGGRSESDDPFHRWLVLSPFTTARGQRRSNKGERREGRRQPKPELPSTISLEVVVGASRRNLPQICNRGPLSVP